MLEVIWLERRKELYGEGFSLRDILRFGWFANGSKAQRGKNYHVAGLGIPKNAYATDPPVDNDYRYIFQIPEKEFQNNTKMESPRDQNP